MYQLRLLLPLGNYPSSLIQRLIFMYHVFWKDKQKVFAFFVIDHNRYFTRIGSSSKSIRGFLQTHIFVIEIFSIFFNIFSLFCVFIFSIIWMFSWFSIFDPVFIFLRFHIPINNFDLFRAFHISEFSVFFMFVKIFIFSVMVIFSFI